MPSLEFQQRQVQKQIQTLSQKQIQSLELLSLSTEELKDRIYKAAQENPALIVKDETSSKNQVKSSYRDNYREAARLGSSSAQGQLDSDNFQKALEAKADNRESLKEHLISQLNMMNLPDEKKDLCEKLIYNLDDKGFHILSPLSILKSLNHKQTAAFLEKCMELVQSLDPPGVCVTNVEESLYVQAKQKNADDLSLFILDGHLDFINPPQPQKALKKIQDFLNKQKALFGHNTASLEKLYKKEIEEEDVEASINLIRSLDPFPTRDYGSRDTVYISPDLYIEPYPQELSESNFQEGLIKGKKNNFSVKLSKDFLPELSLNKDFEKMVDKNSDIKMSRQDKKEINDSLKKALNLIDAVNYRKNTVLLAACLLVEKQEEFFVHGPGHLQAFTQRELSKILEVHESTVSRLANEKFLQCHWGLFEMKYFFTNAVSRKGNGEGPSRDNVMFLIKEILSQHSDDKKALSDQKISDLLKEQGVSVARRTVSKYRAELNIKSSYDRKF